MRSKWVLLMAAFALLAAGACNKNPTSSPAPTASASAGAASAATVHISVDNKNPAVNEAFLSYFPATATVHPGDTLSFKLADSGEPHTVTFGTLVAADIVALQSSDPDNPSAAAQAADALVPELLPRGPGDAFPSGASPCFIASGPVPTSTACTAAQGTQSDFQGTEAYYNSGWMTPTSTFEVKLAATIKPGTYRYLCLLHRHQGMTGQIVVSAQGTTNPSDADQTASGAAQLAQKEAALKPAADALLTGTVPGLTAIPTGPTSVIAGSGTEASNDEVTQFGPSTVTTTVGGSVTWYVLGPHTVTFNPPSDLTGVRKGDTPHIDPRALAPSGGAGQGPPSGPPSGPPKVVQTIDGAMFDGTGFHSSGLILSFPPALSAYKLTFTKAGTYGYSCIVHPQMSGTVIVK